MATSVRLIRRYVWLIDTIRRAGNITFEEINRKWLEERSLRLEKEDELPERTFHRHRQAIADLFGIDILCNRYNGNTYYIENEDALNNPSLTSWLFNGLAIDNQLMGDKEISRRIMFEDTTGGSQNLSPLVEALIRQTAVETTYSKFNSAGTSLHTVEPYGLKQSGHRWYLIARNPAYDGLTVYALDRMISVNLLDRKFTFDLAIDIHANFEEVIGVNVDNDYDCEKVTLRVYGRQRAYIESLPLHKSQRLIHRAKDHSDYELTLRPEYEFQHAILALGPDAEILSPQWLREEIKWLGAETANRYTTI